MASVNNTSIIMRLEKNERPSGRLAGRRQAAKVFEPGGEGKINEDQLECIKGREGWGRRGSERTSV